jgi:hypothetical protein
MTTAEHEATRNLADLQRLPEQEPAPTDPDPGCATTGVTQGTNPDAPTDADPSPDPDPEPAEPAD